MILQQKTDQELLQIIKDDNHLAFKEIYKRYILSLSNFGKKFTDDRGLLKDTLQELFINIWNKRQQLTHVKNLKVYLIKSLRNRLIRKLSEKSRLVLHDIEEVYNAVEFIEFAELEHEKIILKELKKQVNLLPERQREVIHLRYYQQLTHDEISEILSINYQSVSNLLFRAIKKLQQSLQEKKLKELSSP